MRPFIISTLTLLALASVACSPDVTAPNAGQDAVDQGPSRPFGVVNSADTAAVLQTIRTLMGELLPNDQSVASKFRDLVQVLDDPASASLVPGALESVIDKILLEYSKYISPPRNGNPNYCLVQGSPTCQYTVVQLKDKLIADIYAYAGLNGNICKVGAADPDATLCQAPGNDGFVYLPPGIASQLTYVSIQNVDTPLNSGFDEYPVYVRIRTLPAIQFGTERPTVVTCFAQGITYDVAQRARLGHRHENADGTPGYFKLLPPATLSTELETAAQNLCGGPVQPSGSVFGLSTDTPLGRLLASAADFLLPERLQAAAAFRFGFAGASGSPEEFSTFGAVDAGLFRGGASGSPEEFAPPAAAGGPMAASYDPGTSRTTGVAGETATTNLPWVEIQTFQGTPVAGVRVTFTLQATTQQAYLTPSSATFCGSPAPASVVLTTGADGRAVLPCLNFGTVAGFKDLKATIDPTTVDPLACMVTGSGGCSGTDVAHFLVHTTAGPAVGIQKVAGDNQVAPAYSAVPVAPKVKVVDLYGNGVPSATVDWSANVGTIVPNLGTATPSDGRTTTGSDGTTALTSWTLGVGGNTLLAETAIATGVASVTFAATGTFTLTLANACETGGAKDDITKYGFYFPNERGKAIQAIGLHLSSNGAPGASENYEVTLRAERGTEVRIAKARLQSSSNSSKGIESLVTFDFGSNPFPPLGGPLGNSPVVVRLSAMQIVGGQPVAMPSNRTINMNTGGCPAGSKNCKPVAVTGAGSCDITESQLNPFISDYRKGLAARVYTIN